MKAGDVIFYNLKDFKVAQSGIERATRYAILSLPYTVNRMAIGKSNSRLRNIIKGKFAEFLLEQYAKEQGLGMDFTAGETPFWERDRFDFAWNGMVWDLKNNFTRKPGLLDAEDYIKLPALIPNRFDGDQWSCRDDFPDEYNGKGYVFTFMSMNEQDSGKSFFDLVLKRGHLDFIESLIESKSDEDEQKALMVEREFWKEFDQLGPWSVTLNYVPSLIICGVATNDTYSFFADIDGYDHLGYALYTGRWYLRDGNRLNFRNGQLFTRIKNAACPMEALPSFNSVFGK